MIQGCDEEEHKEEDGNNQVRSKIPLQSNCRIQFFLLSMFVLSLYSPSFLCLSVNCAEILKPHNAYVIFHYLIIPLNYFRFQKPAEQRQPYDLVCLPTFHHTRPQKPEARKKAVTDLNLKTHNAAVRHHTGSIKSVNFILNCEQTSY